MRSLLLVDDEPSVLSVLAIVFKLHGFFPTCAANGTAALEAAEDADFDAALIDIHMPGMDGFTFCRELKRQLARDGRPVPAIWIMSGAATAAAEAQAATLGAQGLLQKPFDFATMLQEIEQVLASRPDGNGRRNRGRKAALR